MLHWELHAPHCHPQLLTQVVQASEQAFEHNAVHDALVQLMRQLASHAPAESIPHMDLQPLPIQLELQSCWQVELHPPLVEHPLHDIMSAPPLHEPSHDVSHPVHPFLHPLAQPDPQLVEHTKVQLSAHMSLHACQHVCVHWPSHTPWHIPMQFIVH